MTFRMSWGRLMFVSPQTNQGKPWLMALVIARRRRSHFNESLNFTVTLGADDRTLSDQDESKYLDKVRQNAGQIGAELRG